MAKEIKETLFVSLCKRCGERRTCHGICVEMNNAMQNDNEKLKERNQGRYVAMFDLLHRLEIYEK